MGIPITQPFLFEGNLPNFDRDVINSALFVSQDPLNLSTEEGRILADKYDVGHIVWDVNKRHHYIINTKNIENGNVVATLQPLEPIAMKTQDWYDMRNDYIPQFGEIIIFTDYKQINEKNIPMFKVGDGVNNPTTLPFMATDYAVNSETAEIAEVAKRLEHKLTIGDQEFDGSSDVEIERYEGEYE